MGLVVKKWFAEATPREDGAYVEVVARESGLISWLMALLTIDSKYGFRITVDRVYYETTSLFGYRRVIMPIASISSIYFGYSKPWKKALFWLLLFLALGYYAGEFGETAWALGLGVAGVVVAAIVFILNRELLIGVSEHNGGEYPLALKRSVIEGQEINEAALERITRIFAAVVDVHKGSGS